MNGKKKLLMAISGLASIVIAAPALAVMSAPNGWYLEGNAGSSQLSNENFPGTVSSSGIGGNANLGYKFMPYVGLELGYTQYANSSIKSNDTKAATVKHYSYDMAAKGILPISDSGVEGFVKVGAQRITSNIDITDGTLANEMGLGGSSHSSTGLYWGIGGQVYFIPEMAVVAQWQRAQGSSSSGTGDLYSLGLSFIFV